MSHKRQVQIADVDLSSIVHQGTSLRSTFCDLAVKIDGKCQALIEVKAVGAELRDSHIKQCIDYAANQGIEWAILTNGSDWKIYHVIFAKPIDKDLVAEFSFPTLNAKAETHLQLMYLITREGWAKSAATDYKTQREALSRFYIAAALVSDPVLSAIRRELKRLSPDVRIDVEQIRGVLETEVLKRDVMEGIKAGEAKRALARASAKSLRARKGEEDEKPPTAPAIVGTAAAAPVARTGDADHRLAMPERTLTVC